MICFLTFLVQLFTSYNYESPITFSKYNFLQETNTLLLQFNANVSLSCWGLSMPEDNSFRGIVTKFSSTAAPLTDRVTFRSSKAPLFVPLKYQNSSMIINKETNQTRKTNFALLFLGSLKPSENAENGTTKYLKLMFTNLESFEKFISNKSFQFVYCLSNDSSSSNLNESNELTKENENFDIRNLKLGIVLKKLKITEESFTLEDSKFDENLEIKFSFDFNDSKEIEEKAKKKSEEDEKKNEKGNENKNKEESKNNNNNNTEKNKNNTKKDNENRRKNIKDPKNEKDSNLHIYSGSIIIFLLILILILVLIRYIRNKKKKDEFIDKIEEEVSIKRDVFM